MFHALHKADMCMCYTKQKINLACPKIMYFSDKIEESFVGI